MKKIEHTLIVVSLLCTSLYAQTSYNSSSSQAIEIVDGWEFSGDIRAGWVQYDYANKPQSNGAATNPTINKGHIDSRGIYTMPKLSILSPKNSKLTTKLTLAGATDFGINDEIYESRTFIFDPTNKKSFIILQELFLAYEDKQHKLLIGREELTTPMIDADDWYMLANSFEVAYYSSTLLEDTTMTFGYFEKMSGVWDSGANGTEFHSMSEASFIDAKDKTIVGNSGIYFAALDYDDTKNHNLQLWDYYGEDMYNTLFVQYDYSNKLKGFSYDLGLQFINFKEVGYLASSSALTDIDYSLYSIRFDGSFDFGLDFATGYAKYTDGKGQAATLGAFGGYPYFANGMIFHFFEAGSLQNASSYKGQVGYSFTSLGLEELWLGYRYTFFDLDENYSFNGSGQAQNSMVLNGLRLSYGSDYGMYFTGTYEHVNLDGEPNTFSLRLIGGYKF